jgi:hypothetical protein
MTCEAREAEEEADHEVGADRTMGVQADGAEQGGHPQRPEDETDGAAEQADDPAGCNGCQPRAEGRQADAAEDEPERAPEQGGDGRGGRR